MSPAWSAYHTTLLIHLRHPQTRPRAYSRANDVCAGCGVHSGASYPRCAAICQRREENYRQFLKLYAE